MDGNDDFEQYSRIPTIEDLVALCRNLNTHYDEIKGINIPYLKPALLIETKRGIRPKDIQDRIFLQRLIEQEQDRSNRSPA